MNATTNISGVWCSTNLISRCLNAPFIYYCCVFNSVKASLIQILGRLSYHYKCDRCSKSYKLLNSLRRHKKVECGKGKNIVCVECGHRFYYKQDFQSHVINKHYTNLIKNNYVMPLYKNSWIIKKYLGSSKVISFEIIKHVIHTDTH